MPRALIVVALTALVVVTAGFAGQFLPTDIAGKTDFVEYASAARLLLAGDNPYDASKLLPLQESVGWEQDKSPADRRADMMWNPPWVFPLVLPTGAVPWNAGLLAWVAAQFVAVVVSAVLAWRLADGPPRLVWIAIAAALVFAPTFFLLRLGQISGFILLGLAGFAAAMRAGRPALAGAAAALTAIKPHLLLPFAVLLVCDACVSRATRRAVIAGGIVLVLAAAFPLTWDVDVWRQYVEAVRAPGDEFHHAPSDWNPPILAGKLANATGGGMAVQLLPSVLTTLALVGYWWAKRRVWDWSQELPRVVVLAYLTTGYGAWGFDAVVLLLPVVQAAAWLAADPRREILAMPPLACYVLFNCAILMGLVPPILWAPIFAAGYLAVAVLTRPTPP